SEDPRVRIPLHQTRTSPKGALPTYRLFPETPFFGIRTGSGQAKLVRSTALQGGEAGAPGVVRVSGSTGLFSGVSLPFLGQRHQEGATEYLRAGAGNFTPALVSARTNPISLRIG